MHNVVFFGTIIMKTGASIRKKTNLCAVKKSSSVQHIAAFIGAIILKDYQSESCNTFHN